LEREQVDAALVQPGDPLFVAAVTRDVSARARLARELPGESVLLMFPDQMTAARALSEPDATITYGGLLIDPLSLDVTWNAVPLRLTRLERAVLMHLAEPPIRVWSYEHLYHAVWGGVWLGDTSVLHATVKRLRRKLRTAGATVFLESVRGVGFQLRSGGADVGAPSPAVSAG
jgi:two-component system, OmpR family, response regulator MtrA